MGIVIKFVRWVIEKFAGATLIVTLGLAACALWLFLRDNVDFDQWRQDAIRQLNGDRSRYQAALGDVQKDMNDISAAIAVEEGRTKQADKVIAELKDLRSFWDSVVGNSAQQKANAERLANLKTQRDVMTAKIANLKQTFTRKTWERDGLEIALGKTDAQLRAKQAKQSKVMHYLSQTWNYEVGRPPLKMSIKWWVYTFLAFYFVGPTVGKIALYFLVAPFVMRGRPVRLEESLAALPEMGESHVSAEIALQPGERLWVKEKFLQASDEALKKTTRYLLDWRIPLTCLATRLVELIELRHGGGDGAQQLTLSNQNDPHSELAIITLPAGASLVLRPSFLAGVVTADGRRLVIRRRWQLFRWQSWVTLQFRFFEFMGPCQLVVAGSRGVRVERLAEREGNAIPARRANQDATMGFTPNLDYRPVRAETFWSYYRGMNPLFDDLFAGRGMFLCQQVSASGDASKARRFWAGVWGGAMRVFGL